MNIVTICTAQLWIGLENEKEIYALPNSYSNQLYLYFSTTNCCTRVPFFTTFFKRQRKRSFNFNTIIIEA